MKPLLSYFNPDDALSPQLRVNRGKLSPKSSVVDHILDSLAQIFSSHSLICQDITDSKFALVALGRATSAKFENLDEHINTVFEASKSIVVKKESYLIFSTCVRMIIIFRDVVTLFVAVGRSCKRIIHVVPKQRKHFQNM